MDTSLLIVRVVVGLYVFAHGAHKVFGWFSGAGPKDFESYLDEMGLRPPKFWSGLLGVTETVGGVLFAAGFLSPVGAISVTGTMLISIFRLRLMKGWFEFGSGIELPLTNLAVAVAVGISGPGMYSLDAALGITLRELQIAVVAVSVAYLVVVAALNTMEVRRRRILRRDAAGRSRDARRA